MNWVGISCLHDKQVHPISAISALPLQVIFVLPLAERHSLIDKGVPFLPGTTNHTKDGSVVRKCRVADRSASICFSLWNDQASAIEAGDILRLIKGLIECCEGLVQCSLL